MARRTRAVSVSEAAETEAPAAETTAEPAAGEADAPRRSWFVRGRRLLIDLALFGILLFVVSAWTERGMLSADGSTAPSFVLPAIDGTPVALAELDGPLLVHFWATWCGVCTKQHGGLNRIAGSLPDGTRMVTIAVNSGSVDDVRSYADEHGLSYPILVDADGSVAAEYGISSYPSDFFLNADHEVVGRDAGYAPAWAMSMRLGSVR